MNKKDKKKRFRVEVTLGHTIVYVSARDKESAEREAKEMTLSLIKEDRNTTVKMEAEAIPL